LSQEICAGSDDTVEAPGEAASHIRLSLSFYSLVADLVGERQRPWTIDCDAVLGDLVEALAERYPSLRDYAHAGDPGSGPPLRWVVNGRLVLDMGKQLSDGDEIRVFPVISGG
jgi:molybdopterin converting factor small subunit